MLKKPDKIKEEKEEEKISEIPEMESNDKEIEVFKMGLNRINNNSNNKNNYPNKTDILNNYKLNSEIIVINTKKNERNSRNILTEKNETYLQLDKIEELESLLDYNDDEINDFSYNDALEKDKRNYCQFYISLIKTKHEFLYTFFYNRDYNSKIIKIDLFVFGFALNYTTNACFFNDDTMHNVYENKGLFDYSYQIPIIIYSSLISMFLSELVQMLELTNDSIADFKQSNESKNVNERGKKLIKGLKIRFTIYFIFIYILLIAFWYYIAMFCAIYPNTQLLLLEDTAMGFALSLFTPFVLYLVPGWFRIPALAAPKKNRRCLYNFSKVFTIL